jgi:UDP-3-O-[3-hydroxymyristoyl] glucosamine N-acyltransferase
MAESGMLISEVAELVAGVLVGDGTRRVVRPAKIEEAAEGDVSFVANARYAKHAEVTRASALIVDNEFVVKRTDVAYIRVADPYRAFLKVVARMMPPGRTLPAVIDATAVVDASATLADDVGIGARAVIGPGVRIGRGSRIHPGVVVGNDVTIGENVVVFPNVTIYDRCEIGDNVIVHAGAVIGADGFGFLPTPDGAWEKIPQVGRVVLEQNVEVGANATIDRASLGETRIGAGVKIDNLVHIAHNVVVGANSAIAAQAGISGSTRIGAANLIAGQVGIVGHIETAPNVIIEAQSGVSKTIRNSGRYFGHPAKEHSQALRQEGALRQLPDLLATIRELRDRVRQLEAAVGLEAGDAIE